MSRGRAAAIGTVATVMLLLVSLVACDPSPTQPPGPTNEALASPSPVASGPASSAAATFDPAVPSAPIQTVAFDGLYASKDVSVSGDAAVAVVRSGMTCPALEHMIGAGAWSIAGRQTQQNSSPVGDLNLTVLTLTNGDETALAYLAGGENCTARIARTTPALLRVSGAATFDGSADLDVPLCIASGKTVTFAAILRAPGGPNVQVTVVAPVRTGTARLPGDDVTVGVTRGAMCTTKLAGVLIKAFTDFDGARFVEAYEPTDDSRVRLDVETIDPFVATLHVTDFEGEAGTISLDAKVACHLPGGSLPRAAELAAVPAATTPPGTPGPTLPPFDGAAPGTAVVTGSQIAGTYQMPASGLDCYYDFDQGAWTILSVGGADPTFYLYAFAGQEGGSTSQVSMGLIVGDGGNGKLLLFDTHVSPPDGTAQATVAQSGGTVSVVVQGRTSAGATLSANLSCAGS